MKSAWVVMVVVLGSVVVVVVVVVLVVVVGAELVVGVDVVVPVVLLEVDGAELLVSASGWAGPQAASEVMATPRWSWARRWRGRGIRAVYRGAGQRWLLGREVRLWMMVARFCGGVP